MTTPEFLEAMRQLDLDYDSLTTQVADLKDLVSMHEATIISLHADIDALDTTIANLKAQLAAVPLLPIPPVPVPLPTPAPVGVVELDIPFTQHFSAYGFVEQAKVPGRATMVNVGGRNAVRLHTEPGDNNVAGSGDMERDDLYLASPGGTSPVVYTEGMEHWWWHSIWLPDDFTIPTWHMYALFDFHHNGPTGQANFHINFENGQMIFRLYGGTQDANEFKAPIGLPAKNMWYDFVYHMKWSSGAGGFFDAWVNGVRKLSRVGPTLYTGLGVYPKLANYHVPVCDPYPACIGTHSASSVIHGPLRRTTTIEALGWKPVDAAWQTIVRT